MSHCVVLVIFYCSSSQHVTERSVVPLTWLSMRKPSTSHSQQYCTARHLFSIRRCSDGSPAINLLDSAMHRNINTILIEYVTCNTYLHVLHCMHCMHCKYCKTNEEHAGLGLCVAAYLKTNWTLQYSTCKCNATSTQDSNATFRVRSQRNR